MKRKSNFRTSFICILGIFSCQTCSTIPKGATAVTPFNSEKYLGKWFEIARLDFKYERDLNNTSAEYLLNENGTIKVINRGYNTVTKQQVEAIGKAKFVRGSNVGMLKVSFFGPFYAGYNVLAIDEAYQYALVAGQNLSYLWILSRSTSIPEEIKQKYLAIAIELGFKTNELIWVEHR